MNGSRFVVQEHTTPAGVHWDLMLEQGGALATFRLGEHPAQALSHEVRAVSIFDHPLRFLTYEGPVQKGTAKVRIVDSGAYLHRERHHDRWALELSGAILKGSFVLVRGEGAEWRFVAQGAHECE